MQNMSFQTFCILFEYLHCEMIHKAFPTRWSLQKVIDAPLKEGSGEYGTGGAVHGHAVMEMRHPALRYDRRCGQDLIALIPVRRR